MPIKVAASDQTVALGAAMFAAVVAGVHPDVVAAQKAMGCGFEKTHEPDPERVRLYAGGHERYKRLGRVHRGRNRRGGQGMSAYRDIKDEAFACNRQIPKLGLAVYTFGNVSAFDPDKGVFAIKPSGVPYYELTPGHMVVVDLENKVVEGQAAPFLGHEHAYRALQEFSGRPGRGAYPLHPRHGLGPGQAAHPSPGHHACGPLGPGSALHRGHERQDDRRGLRDRDRQPDRAGLRGRFPPRGGDGARGRARNPSLGASPRKRPCTTARCSRRSPAWPCIPCNWIRARRR